MAGHKVRGKNMVALISVHGVHVSMSNVKADFGLKISLVEIEPQNILTL